MRRAKGFSLLSGGLDSQLAVCVLRDAGADVEGITFETPFFSADKGRVAAAQLGIPVRVIDFTSEEVALIKNPPHGFGGAMNPCIDCHMTMIRKAGELMREEGYDFVATGEVLNQRPMSQNKQSLAIIANECGLNGRLVRPLSAGLLEETVPEKEGLLDRSKLMSISGRCRDPQFALAKKFGLVDYPSPAGGCKLTETGFCNKLRDLMEHEGLDERRLLDLLCRGRRFRLAGGTSVILGRDASDNAVLENASVAGDVTVAPIGASGPTALLPRFSVEADLDEAVGIVSAWSKVEGDSIKVAITRGGSVEERTVKGPFLRDHYKAYQII